MEYKSKVVQAIEDGNTEEAIKASNLSTKAKKELLTMLEVAKYGLEINMYGQDRYDKAIADIHKALMEREERWQKEGYPLLKKTYGTAIVTTFILMTGLCVATTQPIVYWIIGIGVSFITVIVVNTAILLIFNKMAWISAKTGVLSAIITVLLLVKLLGY